jgi:hypothetical protein
VPPSPNRPSDLRTVQTLLQKVQPPLTMQVVLTASIDQQTIAAIREFQKRFMDHPDGRVDPSGRTLAHLNDGFASNYVGCDADTRRLIDRDVVEAKKWLDNVIRRLRSTNDEGMRRSVQNIFHFDPANPADGPRLLQLQGNCGDLRRSFDQKLEFRCEKKEGTFAAFVIPPNPLIHISPGFRRERSDVQIAKLIHERAHTVLAIGHDGMAGAGEVDFGVAPDDPNRFTFQQAIRNAYCYEWLVTALQPSYDAEKARSL